MPTTGTTRAAGDVFAAGCARLMLDLGLTDLQSAGLLGNLGHESGGFRQLQEVSPAVAGSRGGRGLAQWTGPRRVAMEAWCRARGLDPANPEAGYGFLCAAPRPPRSRPCAPPRASKPPPRWSAAASSAPASSRCRAGSPLGAPGARRPARRRWAGSPGEAAEPALTLHPFPSRPGPPREQPSE
ncbi:MAG: phage tail tip lysozyme, partial [Hyphomicrobiales bacterium]